ncbi:hypothetical protein CEDDRAFT_01570 [Frankia sp. CeD]|nr:hypothetical protein CEDDRAFT_01570 [Frankia sp. CeD]
MAGEGASVPVDADELLVALGGPAAVVGMAWSTGCLTDLDRARLVWSPALLVDQEPMRSV